MKNDTNKTNEQSMYAVADIQLAFDNDEIMKMLTNRANALKGGKFEKAKEIQEEMTQYKNKHFDDLTTPRNFFCTFHTEYAYKKALEILPLDFMKMGEDHMINISQATEPTDILWENRHIRKNIRRIRWVFAIILMAILSLCSFAFVFWLLKRKLLV